MRKANRYTCLFLVSVITYGGGSGERKVYCKNAWVNFLHELLHVFADDRLVNSPS